MVSAFSMYRTLRSLYLVQYTHPQMCLIPTSVQAQPQSCTLQGVNHLSAAGEDLTGKSRRYVEAGPGNEFSSLLPPSAHLAPSFSQLPVTTNSQPPRVGLGS